MKYFKHMTNMRNDVKIKRLISRYGIEGYGIYNLMLEAIAEKLETESPIPDLQETCADMADFYNGNTTLINEVANYMINQGLFELDEITGRMICSKIYKFLESSQTRSPQIRGMISAYKSGKTPELPPSVTVSDNYEEQNRTEENRTEENRDTRPKKTKIDGYPVTQSRHDRLSEKYGHDTLLTYYRNISAYVDSKGKKDYADYSATAENWINRDIEQGKFKSGSDRGNEPGMRIIPDNDFDELTRKAYNHD